MIHASEVSVRARFGYSVRRVRGTSLAGPHPGAHPAHLDRQYNQCLVQGDVERGGGGRACRRSTI